MFHTPNEAILFSLKASEVLLHRYVDDLKPAEWHVPPCPGGNTVAWVVGHLALVEHRRAAAFGTADLPPLPAGFADRYGQTKQTAGDQSALDDRDTLLTLFATVRAALFAAVKAAPVEKLSEPPPTANPLVADLGESTLFLGLHAALHLGQVTVIRRQLGYPPVS